MGPVDLNDGLNDTLFYPLHAVKLFIQNAAGLLRVDGLKIITLPLHIHHDGKRPLRMTAFFWRYLMGSCHRKVSSGPETDVVRQGSSCTIHKVRNTLKAGKLHVISGLFQALIALRFPGSIACKQALDHELQKSVLRRKLRTTAKGSFPDFVNRISLRTVFS